MTDAPDFGNGGALPKRPFALYQKSLDDAHDEIKANGTQWAANELVRLRTELRKAIQQGAEMTREVRGEQ